MNNQKNTYQLHIIKCFNPLIIYLNKSDYLMKLQKLTTTVVDKQPKNRRKADGDD